MHMFFHPSRVFLLQWPLSGTMQLTVTCNIILTFSRSAAVIIAGLLYSCKGTSARVCLSSKPIRISLDFTKFPDPDLSLQAATKDGFKRYCMRGKLQMRMQQMPLLTHFHAQLVRARMFR